MQEENYEQEQEQCCKHKQRCQKGIGHDQNEKYQEREKLEQEQKHKQDQEKEQKQVEEHKKVGEKKTTTSTWKGSKRKTAKTGK